MKGPAELHLDGAKAIRTAAGVGLAVLGIALLPGLLKAPEPEPLPPDVGFRPVENLGSVPLPTTHPVPVARKSEARPEPKRVPTRLRGGRSGKGTKGGRGRRDRDRRPRNDGRNGPGPPPVSPPAPAPSFTPTPAPPPPPPQGVGDGSAEFAPR